MPFTILPWVAFLGGMLTIVSPCILPVLPFVFSRAGQPFRRSGLPLLAGMALTFTTLGAMTAVAGHWVVRANQVGRVAALAVFAILGVGLLIPRVADDAARPLVRLGARLQGRASGPASVSRSLVLGVSTGLLWAPCAGPILGLILTGAALEGPSIHTVWLLLSFATGAAVALAIALLTGARVARLLKRSLPLEAWIRRGLGVAVLLGVVGIAFGWDAGVLTRISLAETSKIEQRLLDPMRPTSEDAFPSLDGAVSWLQSPPLTVANLRGKVVLIDFWTYSCINCLRAIPYVQAWDRKYRDVGLVVIGVHTPEFAFEKDLANVAGAVRALNVTYPVAVDSNYSIWKAFNNEYWPAHYVIDAQGIIRHRHFGEGQYEETEAAIQRALAARNATPKASGAVSVAPSGAQAPSSPADVKSPETYIGYGRQENFASPQAILRNQPASYTLPIRPGVNQWGLLGQWSVREEDALLLSTTGAIAFRFHARDLHLVLGPGASGRSVRFRVRIDGSAPREAGGADVDAAGTGSITGYRLYQLIRQHGPIQDRTCEIEFLDPGVQVFAFTFG